MAAFDTPWMTSMSEASSSHNGGTHASEQGDANKTPTVATFSPSSQMQSFSSHRHRSTILVHQKSPLLLATPPQVTRALAYSHPFIVPLNRLAGLLSWTTGDPWESFLFVAAFWFVTLYGSLIIRYTGPLLLVTLLILGMYLRRYSPLSSTGWTGEKKQTRAHKRDPSDTASIKHHKSLDEILATLQTFTTRCNILLDPFLRLTDFLSTQQTATSATTQPALTTLFIRILLSSPIWWALALPPSSFRIFTTKRIILVFGTILLSWHSRPARISRTILWRSRSIRRLCTLLTGLEFGTPSAKAPPLPPRRPGLTPSQSALQLAKEKGGQGEGIRFSFTLFENQRRWLGIGWTNSMLAYERDNWTDEHLNPTLPPSSFELPEVEGGLARWVWVADSEWHVDTSTKLKDASGKGKEKEQESEEDAWVYYDNKWRDGRRGQDGWGRYTRRRKWIRDAELIDVDPTEVAREQERGEAEQKRQKEEDEEDRRQRVSGIRRAHALSDAGTTAETVTLAGSDTGTSTAVAPSISSTHSTFSEPGTSPGNKRRSWFTPRPGHRSRAVSSASTSGDGGSSVSSSLLSRAAASGDGNVLTPTAILKEREAEWGLGDDVHMTLG